MKITRQSMKKRIQSIFTMGTDILTRYWSFNLSTFAGRAAFLYFSFLGFLSSIYSDFCVSSRKSHAFKRKSGWHVSTECLFPSKDDKWPTTWSRPSSSLPASSLLHGRPKAWRWDFFPNSAHSFSLHCSSTGISFQSTLPQSVSKFLQYHIHMLGIIFINFVWSAVMAGTWTGNRCFTNGHKEGNNSRFCNSNDLHVGWWILCKGKAIISINVYRIRFEKNVLHPS